MLILTAKSSARSSCINTMNKKHRILAGLACWLLSCTLGSAWAQVAVVTQHNDNSRTGANTQETSLAPANVNSSQFGKLFTHTLDDQTYSQPLYVPHLTLSVDGQVHNVVFVTTVNNSVYAWDADSNKIGRAHV